MEEVCNGPVFRQAGSLVPGLPLRNTSFHFHPPFIQSQDSPPQFNLAIRAFAQISTITIDNSNTENDNSTMILFAFLPDFEEKCKKVG